MNTCSYLSRRMMTYAFVKVFVVVCFHFQKYMSVPFFTYPCRFVYFFYRYLFYRLPTKRAGFSTGQVGQLPRGLHNRGWGGGGGVGRWGVCLHMCVITFYVLGYYCRLTRYLHMSKSGPDNKKCVCVGVLPTDKK